MKKSIIKTIFGFIQLHPLFVLASIIVLIMDIWAIVLDCKWLAIFGTAAVFVISLINKHEGDTIDCGEY